MSMTDELRVYCIQCGQLRYKTDLHRVFQTGFHQIDGVNYHMATCSKSCNLHKMVGGGNRLTLAKTSSFRALRQMELWC